MLLSIFPKSKAHPSSKEEKAAHSKFASSPHKPVTVEFDTEEDLIEIITNNAWSPAIFSEFRRMSDFVSTDLIAFDIDENMRIEEAEKIVESLGICALCMPSPSHTPEEHRFRLIFPLSRTITDVEVFKTTYSKLAENFPVDKQTSDVCRFYFGCTMSDGFFFEGELYTPVEPQKAPEKPFNREVYNDSIPVLEDVEDVVKALYGEGKDKIPEQVDFFIRNASSGIPGGWHNASNSFIFILSLQGVPIEVVSQVFEQLAPEPLDDHDLYLLKRAYLDGESKRDENIVDKKPEKNYSRRERSRRRSR